MANRNLKHFFNLMDNFESIKRTVISRKLRKLDKPMFSMEEQQKMWEGENGTN